MIKIRIVIFVLFLIVAFVSAGVAKKVKNLEFLGRGAALARSGKNIII